MENMSPADVAAVTRGNMGYGYSDGCGFGGGSAWVMIILFALIFGWGGNGFSRGPAGEPVTEAGLCNSMNFSNLQNDVGRLSDTVQAGQRETDNAVCQLGYQAAQLANQTHRDLCQGFASTNAAINQARFEAQQCCCETQRLIDRNNYDAAMNTAAINANTTAQTQKILDKLCENETNALRARVQQLEMQGTIDRATCGMIRYPMSATYGAGFNPFLGSNCGCNYNCGCNGNI